jgi:hypothetical protein
MPLSVWTLASGYHLGFFNERETINLQLPANPPLGVIVEYKIISGSLPKGLKLIGPTIIGTPFEVQRTTEYKFVVRASANGEISDRTFLMTVDGPDEPNWLTPSGLLPVGPNDAYYVIDSSFIDFQLVASDTDAAAGQKLDFFIASGEGELPPGLILMPNGRITGFIQPLLAVPKNEDQGFYDSGLYDGVAYDFGYRPTNGYDSYVYDLVTYGFSVDTLKPRKLNRNYEFYATITDGDTVTKRKFRIFVVGDDFFRADNVIMQAGTGAYTADVTYLRAPIFTTPKYLGLRRANNYQTFKIDIFEGDGNLGPVIYELSKVNALINAVARKETSVDNRVGFNQLRIERATSEPQVGQKITFNLEFTDATPTVYTITDVDILGGTSYRLTLNQSLEVTVPSGQSVYIGTDSVIPPGMLFDPTTGELFGTVPYQPAVTTSYNFTIKATRLGQGTESSTSRRVFTVDILGEVESVMKWITPGNLGTIDAGFPSTQFVLAESTFQSSAILYTIESGDLPPGLDLNLDGEIIGKVNQPRDQNRYRSYWKPVTSYVEKDIVKIDTVNQIKSLVRRRNVASIVTEEDHVFRTNDIVKVNSSELDFNFYEGVEISVDNWKINNVIDVDGSGPYRIKFSIPTQKVAPLAPVFTLARGTAVATTSVTYNNVGVKSTSGSGVGARFKIYKGFNGIGNPATYVGVTTITLLNPGTGYLPGDSITISGTSLGGVDGTHDLTFVTSSGLEFYYKINGNSNNNYNGRFFATGSTTNTITLNFTSNPGTLGSGLISVTTGLGTYDAQTQITPTNYFNYPNANTSVSMKAANGPLIGNPLYYIAKQEHISDTTFSDDNWKEYSFSEADRSLTVIDGTETYFDSDDSTIDKLYKFTVKARDQLGYSAVTREFTLRINIPNSTYYSNISARPLMKQSQRDLWKSFINNSDVFDPRLIYRLGDPNFGVQRSLASLVYAGIETRQAVEYISAMGLNHKPKRFRLGNIKKALAKEPGTNNVIYEVVYVDLVDPLEKGKIHLPFKVLHTPNRLNVTADNNNEFYNGPDFESDNPFWRRPIPFNSTIDRSDVFAGDSGTGVKFPSSISIWRKRLKGILTASKERNYLPLWMRSIQENSYTEIDWVPAVVLCFCKPGTADEIILNIKNSSFDFKLLDYTIDRYIIDSVDGYYEDKYLVFRNDRTTIV